MDTRLKIRLHRVARRLRTLRWGWSLTRAWFVALVIGILLMLAKQQGLIQLADIHWWWIGAVAALSLIISVLAIRRYRDLENIAKHIESSFPGLDNRLVTATEIKPTEGRFGFLERSVIAEAIRHDITHHWPTLVSSSALAFAWLTNLASLALLVFVGFNLYQTPVGEPIVASSSVKKTLAPLTAPIVAPGNAEIERGTSVIVTATFDGELPDEVWLLRSPESSASDEPSRVMMRQSLQDPIFAAYLYDIQEPTLYEIEYDSQKTEQYRLGVFEYPELVRSDAVLEFPKYTGMQIKTIVDTRRVSAAEQTQLTWRLTLNKAVEVAELVSSEDSEESETIQLLRSAEDPLLVETTIKLSKTTTWSLHLVDLDGRENKVEVRLRARVLPNRESIIRLTSGGDQQVSPLEEFEVAAKIEDDFEVGRSGIGYQFGAEDLIEIESGFDSDASSGVANSDAAKLRRKNLLSEIIDLEALGAKPMDLVSYYVWAEDRDNEGEIRRTVSDMFFLEVRSFEEIYRQGEAQSQDDQQQNQQQQQQQGGNQQTEELLELQKQIVSGTWNVLRKSREDELPGRLAPDVVVLQDSQQQALALLDEKSQEPGMEEAQDFIAAADENMQKAEDLLTTAADSLAKSDLQQALKSEQAAYQSLLRLQAQEFDVARQQQQQGQSQSARSRNRQQQIDQLQLDAEQNRYQNERTAQDQQANEQQEMRQIISRLRELAARQEDLNEQLREIEAALQMAETEEEKKELQEQLERLREQQQQLLEDSDELSERMDSSENAALQEQQDNVEEARENIQQANEALRKGDTSQALASGTRAQEQLEDLQEEVRKEAANQFSESLQSMKEQATELEQTQEELVNQLSQRDEPDESQGLRREENDNADLPEQFAEQREKLTELLEQMQDTVLDAEDAEPLLAQRLYDSFRSTRQERAEERLDVTERLLERNLNPQALELAEESRQDLSNLRERIDEAAESVLGSEVESLERALNQLDQLSSELDSEIADATGRGENEASEPGDEPRDSSNNPTGGSSRPGEEDTESETNAGSQQPASGRESDEESQDGDSGEANQSAETQGQGSDSESENQSQGRGRGESQDQAGSGQPGSEQSEGQPQQSQSEQSSSPQESQQQAQGQRSGPQNGSGGQAGPGLRSEPNSNPNTSRAAANGDTARPITGNEFQEWSDRLRDVEELVMEPELRWEATQIRQAAREIRRGQGKKAADPKWAEVEDLVATPLRSLARKVRDELLRRAAKKTEIVPIDSDPVPVEFDRSVRKYYENLGVGQ